MSASKIIKEVAAAGAIFQLRDDGGLRLRLPVGGTVPPEMLAEVKLYAKEITAIIAQQNTVGGLHAPTPPSTMPEPAPPPVIRSKMNSHNQELAAKIIEITDGLRDYWPLTLRQIYYQLVAKGIIENEQKRYKSLSKLLSTMRIEEMIPWSVIEDRTRRVSWKRGEEDSRGFVERGFKYFLTGYERCLVQTQPRYVELWIEKDALSRIVEKVADPYCIRVVTCKGYNSTTFLKNYSERAKEAVGNKQIPTILYAGDLDPSGVNSPETVISKINTVYGVPEAELIRYALNPEQVAAYGLPSDPDAAKTQDPRYAKYYKRFGNIAVELDALSPPLLEALVKAELAKVLDMEAMDEQREIERMEQEKLAGLRAEVMDLFREHGLAA